jgi:hypothetical protein
MELGITSSSFTLPPIGPSCSVLDISQQPPHLLEVLERQANGLGRANKIYDKLWD